MTDRLRFMATALGDGNTKGADHLPTTMPRAF